MHHTYDAVEPGELENVEPLNRQNAPDQHTLDMLGTLGRAIDDKHRRSSRNHVDDADHSLLAEACRDATASAKRLLAPRPSLKLMRAARACRLRRIISPGHVPPPPGPYAGTRRKQ